MEGRGSLEWVGLKVLPYLVMYGALVEVRIQAGGDEEEI